VLIFYPFFAETSPLLNCTVLDRLSACCSLGIRLSAIANAQKVAASALFLCTDAAIQQHMKTVQGSASGRFI